MQINTRRPTDELFRGALSKLRSHGLFVTDGTDRAGGLLGEGHSYGHDNGVLVQAPADRTIQRMVRWFGQVHKYK